MSSKPRHSKLTALPDWLLPQPGQKADATSLFSALVLADLKGKWIRLSAAVQRQFLGHPVFGKCALRADPVLGDGFQIYRSCCFGTDGDCLDRSCASIDWLAREKKNAFNE